MSKKIEMVFNGWDFPELYLTQYRDGCCVSEVCVDLHNMPRLSQLRFLTWAMSQKWDCKTEFIPQWNATYDKWWIFTMTDTGEDTQLLQHHFDAMFDGGLSA